MNLKTALRYSLLGVVSTLAAFSSMVASAQAATTEISVVGNSWVGFSPIYVAEDMGYYKNLGINVVMNVVNSKPDALAALERGDVAVGMMTIDDLQRAPWTNGTPGIVIGTIDQSLGGDGVVADGSVNSVVDLKGKIVAASANLPATMLLQLALAKHGMSLKDLDVREINDGDAVALFANHSVAAVGTYQPYSNMILKVDAARHPHVLISSAQYPGYIVDVAVVMKNTAAQEPTALKSFLTGIYRAVKLYNTDPSKYIDLAAPHFNLTPAEFASAVSTSLQFTTLRQSQAYMGTSHKSGALFKTYDAIAHLNLSTGAIKTEIPASMVFDNSIVSEISPAETK